MATEDQLRQALIKAHRSKDFKAAELFAKDIKALQEQQSEDDPFVYKEGLPPQRESEIRKEKPEPTLGEKAVGIGETALALGTGATSGLVGQIYGTLKGLASEIMAGKFGTKEAAKRIQDVAEEAGAALTYQPRTEEGQETLKETAEILTPLEALTPASTQIGAISRLARPDTLPKQKALTLEQEALLEAQKRDIPVMTTDIREPKTFVGKSIQTAGERIPLAGTGGIRSKQQEAKVKAIQDLINEYGVGNTEAITSDLMSSLNKTRLDNINKYSNLKKEVIGRLGKAGDVVPTQKTKDLVIDEINKLDNKRTPSASQVAGDLRGLLDDGFFDNRTLTGIEDMRGELSSMYKAPDMTNVKELHGGVTRKIYKALNEDMGDFIKQRGEKKDFTKWKVANKKLSESMGELESSTLKSVLNKGSIKPEDVNRLLFSKAPSEIKLLYKNLNRQGKRHGKVAILNRAVEKAGGIDNISPSKFRSELNKLSNQVGVFFSPEEKAVIGGLSKALAITKRADEFAVNPPTGQQLALPIGSMALVDILGGMGAGIAGGASLGTAVKVYETIPVRRALKKINKLEKDSKGFELAVEELLAALYSIDKEE